MYDWSKMFIDAAETIGQTFKVGEKARGLMEEAGFVDLVEKTYKLPVGTWMQDPKFKDIGRWNLLFLLSGLDGMQLFMLKTILGVSRHLFLTHLSQNRYDF